MKKFSNPLKLDCLRPFAVSNDSLDFNLGPQSILGQFFKTVETLGYMVAAFLIFITTPGSFAELNNISFLISEVFSITLGEVILVLFVLSIIILLKSNNPDYLSISSWIVLLLLFVLWSFGLYFIFHSDFKLGLLYVPLIIIAAHYGRQIVEVKKGDRLIVRWLNKRYEIFHRHSKVSSGMFSQRDIEIKYFNDGDSAGFIVYFFPPNKQYLNAQPMNLFICRKCSEAITDLEKIFRHLRIPYDSDCWNIKNDDSNGASAQHR